VSVVVVLADDLIWSTRLVAQVRAAGSEAVAAREAGGFEAALGGAGAAVVDLAVRSCDALAAIHSASEAGRPVLAVGDHDNLPLRKAALAAGADRVLAYRKLFEDGPATLARWLARVLPDAEGPDDAGR